MPVHIGAKVGFGSETSNYDAARPEHQPPAVEKLLENLAIPHGGRIVEIGAGTGKFTKHIVNRPENWEVICVEPSDDMRETFKKVQPGIEIRDGDAYKLPVEDASADAIICAQAFHWFGTPEALKEFARVLKPGGSLGLIWNHYDRDNWPDYQRKIWEETWSHDIDTPQYRTGLWQKAFDSDVAREYYELPLQQWKYNWTRKIDEKGVWNFIRSLSYINRLPADQKEVMRQHLEKYVAEADKEGKLKRDENGLIEIASNTDIRWIKRK